MKAAASLQIPTSRFDDVIREVWMFTAARRKAAWEARTAASTSGCTNHFFGKGAALDNTDASSISGSGSDGGGPVLDGADTSSTSDSSEGGPVIDVSSEDEGNVEVLILVSN
jgi:hypothetical protein